MTAIAQDIVLGGFGPTGTISLIVTSGFEAGTPAPPVVIVKTQTGGGSSRRYKRRWKTTEEIVQLMREEREFKYIPAPEIEPVSIQSIVRTDFDYELIASRLVNELIHRQELFEKAIKRKAFEKKKKLSAMMLLDS